MNAAYVEAETRATAIHLVAVGLQRLDRYAAGVVDHVHIARTIATDHGQDLALLTATESVAHLLGQAREIIQQAQARMEAAVKKQPTNTEG